MNKGEFKTDLHSFEKHFFFGFGLILISELD